MIIHSFLQFNYVYKAAHLENIELINLFCTNFLIQAIESILGDTKNTLNCPRFSQTLIKPKTSNPVWPFFVVVFVNRLTESFLVTVEGRKHCSLDKQTCVSAYHSAS